MSEDDPHIHVDVKLNADAASRIVLADLFGIAGDLPTVVETGCGVRVPYAMTSPHPESVTCLACRRFAAAGHLRSAEAALRLARMPGFDVPIEHLTQVAGHHRDLAARFRDPA